MNWIRMARVLSFTAAGLLVLAAVWFGLYAFGLTRPPEPAYDPSLPRAEYLRAFFAYKGSVAWQEFGFTLLAALAFLLLAPLGAVLGELLGRRTPDPEGAMASAFFIAAACLLVAGQLVQVGTQWAILSASRREFGDLEALALVWDTGLVVSNWLENGGYFSLALGVLGWGMLGRRLEPRPRAWITLSSLLSVVLLIVVVSQALEIWAIYDIALPVSGAILAPAWLFLTGRVCESIGAKPDDSR
jgi:hypothetical protein